jgi:hypothetical protein
MKTLEKKGIKPIIVFEKYQQGQADWLRQNLPLDDALLEMVVHHLRVQRRHSVTRSLEFGRVTSTVRRAKLS